MQSPLRILYISDLDGTLLNRDSSLSAYTLKTLNDLIDGGLSFSYATARSLSSARRVTQGLQVRNPLILYNGTFIMDPQSGEILHSFDFKEADKDYIRSTLSPRGIYPLVYAYIDGVERVSYFRGRENGGMRHYLETRRGDERLRAAEDEDDLYRGNTFYYTCIGEREELILSYEKIKADGGYNCLFQQELYRSEYWFEITHPQASKGNALRSLRELLGCEKIIAFGDALNDIPLFEAADEGYAVANAVEALKERASGIIASNDDDGVARWLQKQALQRS